MSDETQALRALADAPLPPATTTVEDVIRRGRRRAFVHRAGAVAAVVAVVTGIGVGTALLTAPTQEVETATAPPPETPIDGWIWVEVTPPCTPKGSSGRSADQPLPTPEEAQTLLLDAIDTVDGGERAYVSSALEKPAIGHVKVAVSMGEARGSVQLRVTHYSGTPTQQADDDASVYDNCAGPSRTVLADGTVLQLYPPDRTDSKRPLQHLRVYRPGGRLYVVTSAGSTEFRTVESPGGGVRAEVGSGRLPLTVDELASVGRELAAVG
ncbi:hypothetical protein [Actinophytocola gossypii]|uniref:Uncharacterized protein n=1 Tax=Actinophytocola gossypii TaxID=2812003 RepID=A0ABT2JFF9_9PSEU|nr:hypothetical protein [Actinophytocola gossypii]MCT2586612.1 hypothetical protein [Actinophytocola gossypii]